MRFQILCGPCCDMTATERLGSVYRKVPAAVTVSGRRLVDDEHLEQGTLLRALAAPSLELKVDFPDERAYLAAADPAAEAVFMVTASAALYDQYDAAARARRAMLRAAPGRQVHVFNTRSGSVGQLVTARRICELARSGCSFRQIVERVETELLAASLFLLPASGDSLRQSGLLPRRRGGDRLPAVYTPGLEGRLTLAARAVTRRGLEKRLPALLAARNTAGRTCLIAHCGCPDEARRLAGLLKEPCGFANCLLTEAGAVNFLLLGQGGLAVGF